ncbi:polyketide cyclase [Thiorhodococcus mannitoliphagus]|uniref:Polyketide cyclase n=1 Tax=Thiorhodococcus mannitoliphagus TaxID=329406 RepID=A0A6P1DVG6_9GAMM|nr:SRPBCC family protein [Thiorhodococcus mannitoliphagus]NEX20062.1 polyketide cyclase [Thiorhodococcus mannitoliphagus]
MVKAEAEALIDCPVTKVFEVVAVDFVRNYPRWSPEVELMEAVTDGPIQVGWVGRQVRVDKGRRTQNEFRVVAFDHASQVCFEGLDDPFRIRYRFAPEGERTRVSFDFELDRLNPAAMLFLGTVRRVVQSSAERMMVQLKSLIEDEVAS